MLRLSRHFATLAETVLNLECLKSRFPWVSSDLSANIRYNQTSPSNALNYLSLLVETNSKDLGKINHSLSQLATSLDYPYFSFETNKDHIQVTLIGLESVLLEKSKKIISFLNSASNKDFKSKPINDNMDFLTFSSCFESGAPEPDHLSLFSSHYFISSTLPSNSLNFPEPSSTNPSPSGPRSYKPAMVLIESPGETCEVCLAFKSPGYSSSDYFTFKFLEALMTTDTCLFMNQSKQYNYLNSLLAGVPGVYSHKVKYWPGKNAGLLVHSLETHPLAVPFAGAAVIKAMKRVAKQVILYEIERTQALMLNQMTRAEDLLDRCKRKNEESFSGKTEQDLLDFLLNVDEEFICRRVSFWTDSQFPSVIVKGKLASENVIEDVFNLNL
jgi:hypothetical protein